MMNIRTSANLIVKNKIVLTFCYENYCYPPKGNAQSSEIIIVTSIDYSSPSPPFPSPYKSPLPVPHTGIYWSYYSSPNFTTLSLSHPLLISSYTLLNYSLPLLSSPLRSFPFQSIPLLYSTIHSLSPSLSSHLLSSSLLNQNTSELNILHFKRKTNLSLSPIPLGPVYYPSLVFLLV